MTLRLRSLAMVSLTGCVTTRGPDASPNAPPEIVSAPSMIWYPAQAAKRETEGTIDEEGSVVSTVVLSGPDDGLRDAARDALRQTKFKPTLQDGKPVRRTLVYHYTFSLD